MIFVRSCVGRCVDICRCLSVRRCLSLWCAFSCVYLMDVCTGPGMYMCEESRHSVAECERHQHLLARASQPPIGNRGNKLIRVRARKKRQRITDRLHKHDTFNVTSRCQRAGVASEGLLECEHVRLFFCRASSVPECVYMIGVHLLPLDLFTSRYNIPTHG